MKKKNRKSKPLSKNFKLINERDYFESLDDLMKRLPKGKRLRVVFYDRSSSHTQKDNPQSREQTIVNELIEKYGDKLQIEKRFSEVEHGQSFCLYKRAEFLKAIEYCRKHGCVLLAPSVNRIIRRGDPNSTEDTFLPLRERDMKRLLQLTHDVIMATIIPPGTPHAEVRSRFIKWGQAGKDNRGGRPLKKQPGDKKRLEARFVSEAWSLLQQGYSYRKVSKFLKERYGVSIPHNTIWGWIQRLKNGTADE
jgi:hypothetical protein